MFAFHVKLFKRVNWCSYWEKKKKKEATLKQCLYEWTVTLAQIDSTNLKD